MKRRRLADLYVLGKETVVNDGRGEPVTVWVNKLNDVERESIVRRANAAKARHLMAAMDEESELYQSVWGQVRDYEDRDGLVSIVIAELVVKYRRRVESELTNDEKGWGKDNYLQGLVDAWLGDDMNEGLMATMIESPDDPEVVRVKSELDRFNAEVSERVLAEADRLEAEWTATDDEVLWKKAAHELLNRRGDDVFMREFERQQLFYTVREVDDHRTRYFGTVTEIDDIHETIRAQLVLAFNELTVDHPQSKSLPATPDSSNSSEPPGEETTSGHSGLAVVSG